METVDNAPEYGFGNSRMTDLSNTRPPGDELRGSSATCTHATTPYRGCFCLNAGSRLTRQSINYLITLRTALRNECELGRTRSWPEPALLHNTAVPKPNVTYRPLQGSVSTTAWLGSICPTVGERSVSTEKPRVPRLFTHQSSRGSCIQAAMSRAPCRTRQISISASCST